MAMKDMAVTFLNSGLLPRKYDTTEKVVTVMVKGRELGIGPLQALEQIYVADDGKLAMQADLMRALVLRSGRGTIIPQDVADDHATVQAIRYGIGGRPDTVVTLTFGMDDARRAGLGGDSWRKYPRQLCYARVTSEAVRVLFSDVLAGVVYTPEELGGAMPTPSTPGPSSGSVPPAVAPPEGPSPIPPPVAEVVEPTPETGAAEAPLVHSFKIEQPGGGVRVVRTAGILREQLKQLGDLTTPRGGRPDWQELQQKGRAWLGIKARSDLLYLTQAEGQELIDHLLVPAEAGDRIDGLLAEFQLSDQKEKVLELLRMSYNVADVAQLTTEQWDQALGEIKQLARDPVTFALMVERALTAVPPA